jgi:hypothetical protein
MVVAEKIVFWIAILVAAAWTYGLLSTKQGFMIIPVLLLWGMIAFFYFNPEISRLHILWVAPVLIFGEMKLLHVFRSKKF